MRSSGSLRRSIQKFTVVITGVNVDGVVNGKIVEHGGAANMLESLLEIGAIKVMPSAAG